jgi:hypothetical protein
MYPFGMAWCSTRDRLKTDLLAAGLIDGGVQQFFFVRAIPPDP